MTVEELKEFLKDPNMKKNFGAIAASTKAGSKYFDVRKILYEETASFSDASIAERIFCVLNDVRFPKTCKCGCGKLVKDQRNNYVSSHGNAAPEVKAKKVESYKEKTGYSNPSQNPDVKRQKVDTSIERWGAKSYMQTEEGRKFHDERMLKLHGVINPFQIPEVKADIRQKWKAKKTETVEKIKETGKKTFFEKLLTSGRMGSIRPLFTIDDYAGCDKYYKFTCTTCGNEFTDRIINGRIPRCVVCYPLIDSGGRSIAQQEVTDFIKSLTTELVEEENRHVLGGKELDIYIPSLNIAFEYCGLYWHSEISGTERNKNADKGRHYHVGKFKACADRGIKLITIFEDEWVYRKQQVKARIRALLGACKKIGARECTVEKLGFDEYSQFVDDYHIQGSTNAFLTAYCLKHKDDIVSIIGISNKRGIFKGGKKDCLELVRMCSKDGVEVVGGMSRLLSAAAKDYSGKLLISYADRRWSDGNGYIKTGFTAVNTSAANYWYVKDGERHHRLIAKDKRIDGLTEWESMQILKYDRIWDCGTIRFEKIL